MLSAIDPLAFPGVDPITLKNTVDTIHGLAHPGTKASFRLTMQRFASNGLQKDVCESTRCCIPCQTAKVHRHNKALIGTFDVPDARFHHVHIYLVGSPSPSRGLRFLVPWVDRFIRWCEVDTQSVKSESHVPPAPMRMRLHE